MIRFDGPVWTLNRPALEHLIVTKADAQACQDALKACEARRTPAPSFKQRLFWPALVTTLVLAFGTGAYAETRLSH